MKKRMIAVLLSLCVVLGMTACGNGAKPTASDLTNSRSSSDDEEEDEDEDEEDVKEVEDEAEDEDTDDEKDDKKEASGIVLGSKEAAGYSGFEYLMEEIISTSKTKSGDKVSYSVFIPEEDYPYVSGASASGDRMGVDFEIDIEPYLQYEWEDYTLEENLEEYVNDEMSWSSYYYGIEIGEVKETGTDTVACEVSYMEYDSYDDVYEPYYALYSLTDMGNNVMALATIVIDADNTTGKTQSLLDELASFYQIDIGWNTSFAEKKRTEFENSDEYNADAYNIGFMTFELPDGWEKDEDNSSYDDYIFAPYGDAYGEYGFISIMKEFTSDDELVEAMLSDLEYTQSYFESELGDDISDVKVQDAGKTFLGKTLAVEMLVEESGEYHTAIIFIGQDSYQTYEITAVIWSDADDGEAQDVRDALEMLLETGQLK